MTNLLITWLPIAGLLIFIYSIFEVTTELIPRQYIETVGREKDQFTKLRFTILKLLIYIIVALTAPLIYRLIRIFGGNSELIRSIASFSSAFVVFLFIRTLKAIFNYKYKDPEK